MTTERTGRREQHRQHILPHICRAVPDRESARVGADFPQHDRRLHCAGTRTSGPRRRVQRILACLGSLLLGSKIREFFGITIAVVRVAGGLSVAAMGWKLLSEGGNPPEREAVQSEGRSAQNRRDSFYPLTLPLTVGPGSISVAVTIGSHPGNGTTAQMLMQHGAAIVGVIAIAVTIYVCYRFASPVADFLGKVGINVLVRLSAFILTCIGIQIAWSGISALIAELGH
jgi:multiple antibiotic resistance protein